MDQHIPSVDRADVERIVARDFPPELRPQVLQALSAYGTESYQREPHRVHLDVLKLAGGDLACVAQETENCGEFLKLLFVESCDGHRKPEAP